MTFLLLFTAAFVGGAMNSVAGGGSFFSFPALLFTGMDIKIANVTNAVALWPGSAASVGAYRRELRAQQAALKFLAGVSLMGGLLGAWLLLITPSEVLDQLLPYLLLGATLLFAAGPRINRRLRRNQVGVVAPQRSVGVLMIQLIISIYGGFFGGGIGILMLAALALMGLSNIHEMNALKTLLATLINGIAVITFALAGVIAWPQALLMATGAILGGYGGTAFARRIKQEYVRGFVVAVGLLMSLYLFLR